MGTNRLAIIAILIGLVALGLSIIALLRAAAIERNITNPECQQELSSCYDQCRLEQSAEIDSVEIREYFAQERHLQQLLNCNFISNPILRESCIATENEAYSGIVNSFRVLKRTITDRYRYCRLACAELAQDCENRNEGVPASGGITFDIEGDCEGADRADESCRRKVDRFCTLATGCEDCMRTLCPGYSWKLESSSPVVINLVAATNASEPGRLITTASGKGTVQILTASADMKLNDQEALYFDFRPVESQEKPLRIKLSVSKSN